MKKSDKVYKELQEEYSKYWKLVEQQDNIFKEWADVSKDLIIKAPFKETKEYKEEYKQYEKKADELEKNYDSISNLKRALEKTIETKTKEFEKLINKKEYSR